MHDNSLARALRDQGVDCVLQPVYTPIRTDSVSMAGDRLFFGGIHIYLLQQMPWLRFVPAPIRRLLDWPPLVRLATRRAHATDAGKLGDLANSMLAGVHGNQVDEVNRLVDWLAKDMQPEVILLSNLLIGGALPTIRERLPQAKLAVLLQGDDIFLDHLPAKHREEAIRLCRKLVPHVDRFLVHTQFYADKMAAMLQIPTDKLTITPLSIDIQPFLQPHQDRTEHTFRLGYLARIAPEKGLHQLVDTFIELAKNPQHDDMTLQIAGWLGEANQPYFTNLLRKLEQAGLSDRCEYHGSPDLEQKIKFLRSLDLLCVPTVYEEPKGLFVLEALAAGVPVVQPDHGSFPELIQRTGGGVVVPPGNIQEFVRAISELKADLPRRQRYARDGAQRVREQYSIEQAARHMKEILF
jgi:glycosyltransferase involved in cell wall biosynthesis